MKNHSSLQDRKGVSPIIGYVLLIVLAVSMGATVYYFIQNYIPKEQMQCPEGVSLVIRNVNCTNDKIQVDLINKGLFTLDGVLIKVGEKESTFRTVVNCPTSGRLPPECSIHFNDPTIPYRSRSLKSGENFTGKYNYTSQLGDYEVEIEPLMRLTNSSGDVLCNRAIISQPIRCG